MGEGLEGSLNISCRVHLLLLFLFLAQTIYLQRCCFPNIQSILGSFIPDNRYFHSSTCWRWVTQESRAGREGLLTHSTNLPVFNSSQTLTFGNARASNFWAFLGLSSENETDSGHLGFSFTGLPKLIISSPFAWLIQMLFSPSNFFLLFISLSL